MYLGESISVIGDWFYLNYLENSGMAFGVEFGIPGGKYILMIIRLILCVVLLWFTISYLLKDIILKKFLFFICLPLSGAVGNTIDGLFYAIVFDYGGFMDGRVIDMLYFPLFSFVIPDYIPYIGNYYYTFFNFTFNLSDSYIFIGLASFFIWNKSFYAQWVCFFKQNSLLGFSKKEQHQVLDFLTLEQTANGVNEDWDALYEKYHKEKQFYKTVYMGLTEKKTETFSSWLLNKKIKSKSYNRDLQQSYFFYAQEFIHSESIAYFLASIPYFDLKKENEIDELLLYVQMKVDYPNIQVQKVALKAYFFLTSFRPHLDKNLISVCKKIIKSDSDELRKEAHLILASL